MSNKVSSQFDKGGGGKQKLPPKSTPVQPVQGKPPQPVRALQNRNQNKSAVTQRTNPPKKISNQGNMPANAKSQVRPGNNVQNHTSPGNNHAQPGSVRGQVKPKQDGNGLQKRSFISEQEIAAMLGGLEMDKNNNNTTMRGAESQESLNQVGAACLVNIAKVYASQQKGFDKLDGSKLVEDVLLKGKFWRDSLSAAEERKDSINVYGLKVVFHSPNMIEMSKKRFFACIHLHNALRNFGIRSALAVHIDISGVKHKKVSEIAHRIVQLVGDGYNFFALQFKLIQTSDPMRRLFNEPGAYGIYIGFAFILDYLAYRNKCKKHNMSIEYDIKKYVEVLGDEGYVIRGIDKSAGSSQFEFEVTQEAEDLHLEYVEHLFNGVRFTA
uniref:Uncharacterized protein n=1 Tax=Cacopsylla melanoneura TaxID=428564 RepID=A0A8D8T9G5_9HEMI